MTPSRAHGAPRQVHSFPRRHGLLRVLAAALLACLGLGATCNDFPRSVPKQEQRFDEAVRLRGIALASMEEDRYEDWLFPHRQKLQDVYLSLLDHLSQYYFY